MSTDLRTYKAMVVAAMKRAVTSGEPEVFENSGPEHARIVLDVMLENASSSVDVISGKMDVVAWSSSAIASFLQRNPQAQLRVMLDEASAFEYPDCCALSDLPNKDRIEVRWLPVPLNRHLCIADRSHVRLEYDKQTAEASITFGDPEGVGAQAADIFDRFWVRADHACREVA